MNKRLLESLGGKKSYIYIAVMLIVGVILLLSGKDIFPANSSNSKPIISDKKETLPVENSTEKKLEAILSQVEGVGKTDVMIVYDATAEKVPLREGENENSKAVQQTDGTQTGPYISQELYPEIKGVIVVAEGGGVKSIADKIADTVSEVLSVPIHKVKILKMN